MLTYPQLTLIKGKGTDIIVSKREEFLDFKSRRCKPRTIDSYGTAIDSYTNVNGQTHWPPTEASILRWLSRIERYCEEATVRSYYCQFRVFINWLHRRGYIDCNPCQAIQEERLQPREPKPPPQAFTENEAAKIMSYLDDLSMTLINERDKCFAPFMLMTGLRSGEAVRLRWSEIDLVEQSLIVQAANAKDDEFRVVYFSVEIRELLFEWQDYLFEYGYQGPWVFPSMKWSRPGGRWRANSAYHRFQDILEAAGVERRKLHATRHYAGVLAAKNGVPVGVIADQLGHSDIRVTMRYVKMADLTRADYYKDLKVGGGGSKPHDQKRKR